MTKIRYRYEGGTSWAMREKIGHIARLGKLQSIIGYRFRSTRGTGENQYTTTHERVAVVGENGRCRFDGICWGYGGSGPHALLDLLLKAGVPQETAKKVAFEAPRHLNVGVDWIIEFDEQNAVEVEYPPHKPLTVTLTA